MEQDVYCEIGIRPSLLFVGANGAGRRRLAAVLASSEVEHRELLRGEWEAEARKEKVEGWPVRISLLDTPSADEGNPLEDPQYQDAFRHIASAAQVCLYIIDYPVLPSPVDLRFLQSIKDLSQLPLIAVGTGIDRASEDFVGKSFDLEKGKGELEQNIRLWRDQLAEMLAPCDPREVMICAAGKEEGKCYGLGKLSDLIRKTLPPAARIAWQTCSLEQMDRGKKADKLIIAATAVAGGIGVAPLPLADMPFIVTTQVSLLASLFHVYERSISPALLRSLALAGLSAVVGPVLFGSLAKVVPGMGSVLAGGVAASCTWAVGQVAKDVLERGGNFDTDDFKEAVRAVYQKRTQEKQ